MLWSNRIQEIVGIPIALAVIWYVVIRPWRRLGHISLDGTFVLVLAGLYWVDPMPNYFGTVFSYNSAFVNFGSWTSHIPGWLGANGSKMPEPLLYAGLFYLHALFGLLVLGTGLLRLIKRVRPGITPAGQLLVTFVVLALTDLTFETAYVRLGAYTYGGVYKPLTLFYGHYYQLPILCPIFSGIAFTGMSAIRYFRNDRGESLVERGLDRLPISDGKRHVLRFFAIFGVFNALAIISIVPLWWTASHAAPWPKDILERSYFTNGVCGPGSDVACPGGVIPPQIRDKVQIAPDNSIVVPSGQTLPTPVQSSTR
jgi:Spirocyclase AveC-like